MAILVLLPFMEVLEALPLVQARKNMSSCAAIEPSLPLKALGQHMNCRNLRDYLFDDIKFVCVSVKSTTVLSLHQHYNDGVRTWPG